MLQWDFRVLLNRHTDRLDHLCRDLLDDGTLLFAAAGFHLAPYASRESPPRYFVRLFRESLERCCHQAGDTERISEALFQSSFDPSSLVKNYNQVPPWRSSGSLKLLASKP